MRGSRYPTAQTLNVSTTLTVNAGGFLSDYPQASSTVNVGSSVTNNGTVFFDGAGLGCLASPPPNYLILRSTVSGTQSAWSGIGRFVVRYTNVKDQTSSVPITVLNGTSTANNGANWIFSTGAEPQLVQSATSSGGSGTTNLTLPAFGSSPSYALSLYYAKNIVTTSSFAVTAKGGGGASQFLSATAFEYTGVNGSSTFDTSSSNTPAASSTAITSFNATGQSAGELYFGIATFAASTTASSGAGRTSEAGITNNNTTQALYTEDVASTSQLTIAATWTAVALTNYSAMLGIFHSPYISIYAATGTLDSATFDTAIASGTELNSFIWQGSTPSNSAAKFQFAVSNSSSGPWNYQGTDGSANTYFSGAAGVPVSFLSTAQGYALFNGYRYFRYRVTLFADSADLYTPTVTQVSVNWSP
jgi:hypothetical protein